MQSEPQVPPELLVAGNKRNEDVEHPTEGAVQFTQHDKLNDTITRASRKKYRSLFAETFASHLELAVEGGGVHKREERRILQQPLKALAQVASRLTQRVECSSARRRAAR